MKVAVVDWDITYPMNSGKRLRTLNLMMELATRHDLTYVSRGVEQSQEAKVAREFLEDNGIRSVFLNQPVPGKSGWQYPIRVLRNVASANPYAVDVHQQPSFRSAYRRFVAKNPFDVWQFEWTPYSTMLNDMPDVRKLIVAHNVDSLIWQRYHETETRPLHKKYIAMQAKRFKRFESHAFRTADRIVSVSSEDDALMREMFAISHVDVVDNGVDLEAYAAVGREPQPGRLLFLGSLDWRPNLDAIGLLLRDILPRIRERRPECHLTIVGRNPPRTLKRQVEATSGAQLFENVPDVFPYLRQAAMMVVPLRIGGGSRLKIIEALAASVPVVASSVAAEGLDLDSGVDYALANTSEAMADAVIRWLDNPEAAKESALKGLQSVRAHYGWDQLAEKLERSWERCLNSDSNTNQIIAETSGNGSSGSPVCDKVE
ncbi:MAG: glycosyltransferase family 4 protein [Planctomycetota bacterium]